MTADPEVELLHWYIEKYETPYGQSTLRGAGLLRHVMPPAARLAAKQRATRALAPGARRKAARLLQSGGPVRLHLGCGWNKLPGWHNVDLVGGKVDLVWDIRQPLPYPRESVDVVFMEHVLEHLRYGESLVVLNHVRRVLKPGGVLRVGVPDAGWYSRLYVEEPDEVRTMRWGRPTAMLALREVFQEHGHVSAFDAETLDLLLTAAGFDGMKQQPPGQSELLNDVPDMRERWEETLYMETQRD